MDLAETTRALLDDPDVPADLALLVAVESLVAGPGLAADQAVRRGIRLRRAQAQADADAPLDPEEWSTAVSGTGAWVVVAGTDAAVLHPAGAVPAVALVHDGEVLAAAFSPDGGCLATVAEDGTLRLWDATTGRETGRILVDDTAVYALAVADGSTRVAAAGYHGVRVWDVDEPGRPRLESVQDEDPDPVIALALSPDGAHVLTGSAEFGVVLHDVEGGRSVELTGVGGASAVAFSADGMVAVAAVEDDLRVWRVDDGEEFADAGLPDVAALATGSAPGEVIAVTGDAVTVWRLTPDHDDPDSPVEFETAATFEVPGVVTAAVGRDGVLAVVRQGAVVALVGAAEGVQRAAWLPSTGAPRRRPVGSSSGAELVHVRHDRPVNAVALTPDGGLIVTGDMGGTSVVVQVRDGARVATLSHGQEVTDVALDVTGAVAATLCVDGIVRTWSVPEGRLLWQGEFGGRSARLAFSPDARHVLVAGASIRGWDVQTGALLFERRQDAGLMALAAGFPDGPLAVLTDNDQVHVVRPDRDGPALVLDQGGWPRSVALGPDGVVAIGSLGGTVALWDLSGQAVWRLEEKPQVRAIALSADGALLAAGVGKDVVVRDARSGELLHRLHHPDDVTNVVFDPTSALVAACSDDTCHLWRLDIGSETARLTHDSTVVQRPVFSLDGAVIATPGWDGTARLWAATPERLAEQGCAEAGRTLTDSEWATHVGDGPYRPRCS